ncbi:MAG: winged helix-turn-helix transcriptional regulator, partial [Anaerolineales bacterium]|nr:winged helix-turn-helix transcriptional regulator [Anaerolineales bacterium]
MTEPLAQQVFLALGDPMRRELLERLVRQDGQTATELAAELPITRQGVSKHLAILSEAGLVSARQQGRDRRYSFTPGPLHLTVDWISALTRQW